MEVKPVYEYFRREDTFLARMIKKASPKTGKEYLKSNIRRLLDLSVSLPASTASIPIISVLGLLKILEDGGPAFFFQKRYGKGMKKTINLIKIRCMKVNSDYGPDNIKIAKNIDPANDPRNTKLGRLMRKHQLEELPQLFQVALNQLSLIGLRSLPDYDLKTWTQELDQQKSKTLIELYKICGGSLIDIITVLEPSFAKKTDRNRLAYYEFYGKKASLGLDLYILWRTFIKLSRLTSIIKVKI